MIEPNSKYSIKNSKSKMTKKTELMMLYISDTLLDMKFQVNLKGFIYVKKAIFLYIQTPLVDNFVNDIYDKIAEEYDTTSYSVERAIRYAIECAWYKGGINCQHELFKRSSLKSNLHPTNSEFIATMAEIVNVKMKKDFLKV